MTTTSYYFLSVHPIFAAPNHPYNGIPADLQSGPGSLQSRGSTDFATAQSGASCREVGQSAWTRNPIALARGSVVDTCVRLGAMQPIRYLWLHIEVDNLNMMTIQYFHV